MDVEDMLSHDPIPSCPEADVLTACLACTSKKDACIAWPCEFYEAPLDVAVEAKTRHDEGFTYALWCQECMYILVWKKDLKDATRLAEDAHHPVYVTRTADILKKHHEEEMITISDVHNATAWM